MNPQPTLSICLFSDANFLAVNMLENLLSKNCFVNIVTTNVGDWQNKTSQLSAGNKFSIIQLRNFSDVTPYDYAIFCGGFIDTGSAYRDLNYFNSLRSFSNSKKIILLPLEVFESGRIDRINISDKTSIVFIGDLLGPRINLESNLLMPTCLSEILWKRKLTLPVGEILTPIFVPDAVRVIVKWLFSFGPYGKVVLLLGNPVSGDAFLMSNKKYFPDLVLTYDTKKTVRSVAKDIETVIVGSNLNFSLAETYAWLKSRWSEHPNKPIRKDNNIKVVKTKKIRIPKYLKPAMWGFVVVLVFPLITLLTSLFISFLAYKGFVSGRDGFAQNSFLVSRTFAAVSEKESNLLSYVPALGLIYKEVGFAAVLTQKADDTSTHLIPLVRETTLLFGNILGDAIYNSTEISSKIESDINLIYNDVTSIKSIIDIAAGKNIILAKKTLSRVDFERFIRLLFESRTLAKNAPALLGQDKSKTYLVLFQNNMELRPTGGFIGSFGLLTFDKGRLSDLTINDVYSADGQLNGHVEPPLPIKNYLGEANWWLRDSNWDPDFPTSAKRAEWFLDKELSKSVDGVIAMDLYPIKEVLRTTGPVFLSDYDMNITSENLYEKTQNEVENNFFAGTHKKASFLTALARGLLADITKLKTGDKVAVLRALYDSLSGRHAQVYLHDNQSQEAFSALGWDGAVTAPNCGTGCYADLVGIVEANVGMNKVNYFIQRDINLETTLASGGVNHKLTLTLKDTANPALGPSARYKNYLRLLIPSDASLTSVVSYNGSSEESLTPELTDTKGHKEVGVLVELLAESTKKIEFSWKSAVGSPSLYSKYGLYFRKQAGTDADPIRITFGGVSPASGFDPRLTLTKAGTYVYNTTLAQDLFFRLPW